MCMNETGTATGVKKHLVQYSNFVEGNLFYDLEKNQV